MNLHDEPAMNTLMDNLLKSFISSFNAETPEGSM